MKFKLMFWSTILLLGLVTSAYAEQSTYAKKLRLFKLMKKNRLRGNKEKQL